MKLKGMMVLAGKLILLTVLFFVIFSGGGDLLSTGPELPATGQPGAAVLGLLLMSVVDTLVVAVIILHSQWTGWRLALATGFAFYGVMTFMSQIETLWFAPSLEIPLEVIPGFFMQTIPLAVIFVPLAVLILGKWRAPAEPVAMSQEDRLRMPVYEWAWKLALIAGAYLVLYFGFGAMIAWQNPTLRMAYDSGANQDVFSPYRLVPFQILRSALWVGFAVPVVRLLRTRTWGTALIVGLLYALPMNMFHAIPNPFMVDSMRLFHFIETVPSNFIFGVVVVLVLLWHPEHVTKEAPH